MTPSTSISSVHHDNRAQRERVACIGGLLESVFMRRDLTLQYRVKPNAA